AGGRHRRGQALAGGGGDVPVATGAARPGSDRGPHRRRRADRALAAAGRDAAAARGRRPLRRLRPSDRLGSVRMTARHDFAHVTFISAGAGSGKTYRLTEELEKALTEGGIAPSAVIGTTFTVKAAGELKERVRSRLIESGRMQLGEQMAQALIGTVHSVCERLLQRFAFELGLSPALEVMSLEDGRRFFNQALDDVLSLPRVREMNALAARLGQEDWQAAVKAVADKVRENDLGPQALPAMARE